MAEQVDPNQIIAAYKRAEQAGLTLARFEFDTGLRSGDWSKLGEEMPRWLRLVGKFVKFLFKRLFRPRPGESTPTLHVEEGIVDLATRRRAMRWAGSSSPVTVTIDGSEWTGTPGEPLEDLVRWDVDATTAQPSWLLSLLRGTVEARSRGTAELRGSPCHAFDVQADLGRASAATPGGLPTPQVARFEELLALPLRVHLDEEGRIRRVAGSDTFNEMGNTRYVVELYDLASAPSIDWTKIPWIPPIPSSR